MRRTIEAVMPVGVALLSVVLLVLTLGGPASVSAQVSTPTAGEDAVYRDPQGRFSIPIPTNWVVEEHDGYVTIVTLDKKVAISLALKPKTLSIKAKAFGP